MGITSSKSDQDSPTLSPISTKGDHYYSVSEHSSVSDTSTTTTTATADTTANNNNNNNNNNTSRRSNSTSTSSSKNEKLAKSKKSKRGSKRMTSVDHKSNSNSFIINSCAPPPTILGDTPSPRGHPSTTTRTYSNDLSSSAPSPPASGSNSTLATSVLANSPNLDFETTLEEAHNIQLHHASPQQLTVDLPMSLQQQHSTVCDLCNQVVPTSQSMSVPSGNLRHGSISSASVDILKSTTGTQGSKRSLFDSFDSNKNNVAYTTTSTYSAGYDDIAGSSYSSAQQQRSYHHHNNNEQTLMSLNSSIFSNMDHYLPNNIQLSISSPSIITPTTNKLLSSSQPHIEVPAHPSILHASLGSTSELFNNSLISSFLSSHPQPISAISPPSTPRTYNPKDSSYDSKDSFVMSSTSLAEAPLRRTSVSRPRNNQSHYFAPSNDSSYNDSVHFNIKKDDYSKDVSFMNSDHESNRDKSTSSTSSINPSKLQHLATSQRPRGRSISDSLYMLSNSKETRALENEKIKKNRYKQLRSILKEVTDIIEISDIQFVQKIGEGSFSEVWEGWWNNIHVAVKKLKIVDDESLFKERFKREVENLKRSNHQNIVMFIGACYKPPCIITEYMSGGSLYSILHNPSTQPKTKYSFPLVLKMASDIALGLMHMHSLNIVHRDLTSQNILLDELGNVKISDFGLSREKPADVSMNMTNGGICNPRWRPPEITKNLGNYSEKIDVYCFSLVVWELLTGEIPFSDLDGSQASAQVAYAGLRPPIPENCHKEFADLLVQCWQTDPADRPLFPYVVAKLKEISWNNPIGFISDQATRGDSTTTNQPTTTTTTTTMTTNKDTQ
ncbi:hypothetical protein SAMD00019534_049650 [Acytostelium subglobosum LB1]|uniref:hypothetical protein n=1 Tax=Acytostelium subglobosum LB1 TaxID=1410327 RepID=UPI0006451418|nr:hypothetical protein SAMD00019534_049650 [Acytostelium subglobosum LB1]GAM21790.1 hypothetical protein SAMD00019534_049650 [Acytostelium subglobosum LB1]|eukprot:XP_012754890.1 hypothetical protein SAMD00019534_049650 [Acytostelium subglobosum LB1]